MAGALTRWDPFAEIADLRSRFDRMLDETGSGRRAWMPAIDLVRDDGNLVLKADMPGIKPEEVRIEVEDGVLTVSGEHDETTEHKDDNYLRRERRHGSFTRSVALPAGVDPDAIEATTHDGVLEVKIPLPQGKGKATVEIKPST